MLQPRYHSTRSPLISVAYVIIFAATLAGCAGSDLLTAPDAISVGARTENSTRTDRELGVMSYNVYQGTELENSLAARTPTQFVIGAGRDFDMMRQTNFAARAEAIATDVRDNQPDLIGLQEVALWRRAPFAIPSPPAATVEQDFLTMLLDALETRGLHYAVVSTVNNFDVQGPALLGSGMLQVVRLTDRNVILARTDVEQGYLAVSNPQAANFVTNLHVPTVNGDVTVLEGWAAVDVKRRGRTVRFITTHLDAFVPAIRAAQANEVLTGPANTSLPVVLVGDLNSETSASSYLALAGAGFADAWASLHPDDPGFTCCQELPTIANAASMLAERIDYVLARGLRAERIERLGATLASRTSSGLWPSDHAGLTATLVLQPTH
jgi:endonuclease/exonuclease/phosphatase family metal-dependent hydrolase